MEQKQAEQTAHEVNEALKLQSIDHLMCVIVIKENGDRTPTIRRTKPW